MRKTEYLKLLYHVREFYLHSVSFSLSYVYFRNSKEFVAILIFVAYRDQMSLKNVMNGIMQFFLTIFS